ncbi:hypothetical protein CMUS01_14122 [Colletotrichum musicola]|uniref:Cyanovirin-N domain-containing protein n=1 Tax=Colletotrichum musicola TaxID=2175873 RepID=A0A8H6MSK0_9PEZI|nr:hypothetical protein CMUS01_14122 [Colletotrichum musicola]
MKASILVSACAAVLLAPLEVLGAALPEDTSPADISPRQEMTLFGGFAASCSSFTLNAQYPTLLYANCRTISGAWKTSHLSLNLCLANRCGTLASASRGGYAASCATRFCQLIGSRYQCNCNGCSNNEVFSIIELNDIVGNDNGDLICHGLKQVG